MHDTPHSRPSGLSWTQLFRLITDPLRFGAEVTEKHGSIVHLRDLRGHEIYIVNEPGYINDMLTVSNEKFGKGTKTARLQALLGANLFNSEGELHGQQRRLVQHAFQAKRLSLYANTVLKHSARLARRWDEGSVISIFDEMTALTSGIIVDVVLGVDSSDGPSDVLDSIATIYQLYERYTKLPFAEFTLQMPISFSGIAAGLPLPYRRRFLRARDDLHAAVDRIIREHEIRAEDQGDMLSALIRAGSGDRNAYGPMRDEIVTLLFAGSETMASALTWTLYLLSAHPGIEARVRSELKAVLGARKPTADDASLLTYTRQVLAEAMRLFPPSFVLWRSARQDYDVGRLHIPAGADVVMSQHIMHRSPLFHENPSRFDPDRFSNYEFVMNRDYSYFPFGGGRRRCIGEAFAWLEGTLVLATVVPAWQLRPLSDRPPRTRGVVTLRPRRKIYAELRAHEAPNVSDMA